MVARKADVVIAGEGFSTFDIIIVTSEIYWLVGIALLIVMMLPYMFMKQLYPVTRFPLSITISHD